MKFETTIVIDSVGKKEFIEAINHASKYIMDLGHLSYDGTIYNNDDDKIAEYKVRTLGECTCCGDHFIIKHKTDLV